MDKPLPDRVRPLEGAGMANLYGDMGVERRRWVRQWPQGVALCAMLAAVALVVVLA
jgi:hypothetical protein